jgi:hypothetical protein
MTTERTAWYSAKAVVQWGSNFWRTPDGREVEVTSVGDSYGWDDKVSVGPVTEWVRKGVIGTHEREYFRVRQR